jgi:ribosome assembly protein YihI (activator of Der GTPase)
MVIMSNVMKDIHNKPQTDINNLSPIEELEQSTWHATNAVLDLIRAINTLPVEQSQHIKEMFNRVEKGEDKNA